MHLTTVRDLNIGPSGLARRPTRSTTRRAKRWAKYTTPGYRLVNRVNPDWRRVNSVESGGNSYYNGLVVQLRKRLSHGWRASLAYTWSHAIDFNQGGGADNIFFSDGPRTLTNGDYRGGKGLLPTRPAAPAGGQFHVGAEVDREEDSAAHALGATDGGFRRSSTFASAQPATPTILVSGVPFPGAAFNSTVNGFGGSNRVPFYPASSLPIDQVMRTDARLTKILALSRAPPVAREFRGIQRAQSRADTAVNTVAFEARNLVSAAGAAISERASRRRATRTARTHGGLR